MGTFGTAWQASAADIAADEAGVGRGRLAVDQGRADQLNVRLAE